MVIENMVIRFLTPDVGVADAVHKITNYELPRG